MTSTSSSPVVLLVAGHWLGAWAWDDVLTHLDPERLRAETLTLPGLDPHDPDRARRTLDDQAAAIADRCHSLADGPVTLVAHSGANAPVSMVLDRHPHLVRRVIWVDSGPFPAGAAFAADLSPEVEELPLPAFAELAQQASLDGLDDEQLERFRARAVPEPAPVLREPVALANDARHAVPTTLVCCSLPSAQMFEMARAGHPFFRDVPLLEHVDVVDLPTGHWPMWSRPADLARVIREGACSS